MDGVHLVLPQSCPCRFPSPRNGAGLDSCVLRWRAHHYARSDQRQGLVLTVKQLFHRCTMLWELLYINKTRALAPRAT